MIEHSKFNNQLLDLRKIILDGVSYFIVWQGLTIEYEDSIKHPMQHTDFWWQYRGFFAPARKALLTNALLELSKAFDRDTRNVSIGNLLKLALQNRKELLPHATRSNLNDILSKIDDNTELLEKLRDYRNKRLVHYDAELVDDIKLPPEEVNKLIEETKSIYNSVKFSHDGKYDDFNDIMEAVYLHTDEVISIMKNRAS